MKKWLWIVVSFFIIIILCFIPYERSIVFTETRAENPAHFFLPLKGENAFQLIFTHSIHLTDVTESYKALPADEIQLLSMEYSDVAIGMPGYAEKDQTLQYEDGVYTLVYNDAKLKEFTLHIGDVDNRLDLRHKGETVPLKEHLSRGKSYQVMIKKLSSYDKLKGVELND